MTFSLSLNIADLKIQPLTSWAPGGVPPVGDEAMFKILQEMLYPAVGLLPPVVRWISPRRRWVLFERPPRIQTIHFFNGRPASMTEGSKIHTFAIPLPWQLYRFHFNEQFTLNGAWVYATKGPISSLEDTLAMLPLPNHYADGHVCVPYMSDVLRYNDDKRPSSLGEAIELAYRVLWASNFNTDATDAFAHCCSYGAPSYIYSRTGSSPSLLGWLKAWESGTVEQALQWDWAPITGHSEAYWTTKLECDAAAASGKMSGLQAEQKATAALKSTTLTVGEIIAAATYSEQVRTIINPTDNVVRELNTALGLARAEEGV